MWNVSIPFKRVDISNLMTFEWCFLISNMRIAMQCHPSLYYIMYLETLLFVVQCNVLISLLWFLLSLLNCVPYLPTCQRAFRVYVLTCQRVLLTYVSTCQRALCAFCAYVPTCSLDATTNNKNKFSIICFPYIFVIVLSLFLCQIKLLYILALLLPGGSL